MIKIYTDGACNGNPGPGGYGVVVFEDNEIVCIYSQECDKTTNNREELKAIIRAFKIIKAQKIESAVIFSDSAYAVNMINDWIWNWAKNNWMNSKNRTVENVDLVKEIYDFLTEKEWTLNYSIEKIKGHNGHIGNEIADALATRDMKKFAKLVKENNKQSELNHILENL